MLTHCITVLEGIILDDVDSDDPEDLECKIDFNVKAVLRLACNMVTQAPD